MIYELAIHPDAEKEWAKLDGSIKRRFKEKLAEERLKHPRVVKDALREFPDCYKIKLRSAGVRIVYRVDEGRIRIVVVAVGKRDSGKQRDVYDIAFWRLSEQ